MLPDREILALHRAITAIPSVSGEEGALADFLGDLLRKNGVAVTRLGAAGATLLATVGEGPLLLFDTHLDTVPPAPGWTRDPWDVQAIDGRVYGLGSNDAKAAVAAMTAAFLAFGAAKLPFTLALALVEGEETRGTGTEAVLAELARRGTPPAAAVVGEPTGLDLAVAQKGLLVLELVARGDACHAAHAATPGCRQRRPPAGPRLGGAGGGGPRPSPSAPRPGHPGADPTAGGHSAQRGAGRGRGPARRPHHAGRSRVEAGGARPERRDRRGAGALGPPAARGRRRRGHAARRRRARGPRGCAPGPASTARPTLSDLVFLAGIPAVKCGPGRTERSHTADEFVLESEILAGARFYTRLVRAYAEQMATAAEAVEAVA